jgi:hypothetical protein
MTLAPAATAEGERRVPAAALAGILAPESIEDIIQREVERRIAERSLVQPTTVEVKLAPEDVALLNLLRAASIPVPTFAPTQTAPATATVASPSAVSAQGEGPAEREPRVTSPPPPTQPRQQTTMPQATPGVLGSGAEAALGEVGLTDLNLGGGTGGTSGGETGGTSISEPSAVPEAGGTTVSEPAVEMFSFGDLLAW